MEGQQLGQKNNLKALRVILMPTMPTSVQMAKMKQRTKERACTLI